MKLKEACSMVTKTYLRSCAMLWQYRNKPTFEDMKLSFFLCFDGIYGV